MKSDNHKLWHYVLMVLVSEIVNLIWMAVGISVGVSGYAIFSFSSEDFFKLAVGIPLGLIGVGLFLFKVYELFLVVIDPTRIRIICKFCRGNTG